MKQQEIAKLRLIESIEQNPFQTQRDLSAELKISLGRVNSFTKCMINKGYIKTTTIQSNRLKYDLTPKGISEKEKLTYKYILYSFELYKEIRSKFKMMYQEITRQNKKRVFFLGISELTEIALIALKETNLELGDLIDEEIAGSYFMGNEVHNINALKKTSSSDVVIITRPDFNINLYKVLLTHIEKNSIIGIRK